MTQTLTVRTARERLKPPLTQEDLAAAVGVDQTYISLIERGLRTPSDGLKERLAQALELAPSKLRFGKPRSSQTVKPSRDRVGHLSMTRKSKKGLEETLGAIPTSDGEGSPVSRKAAVA